MFGIEKDLVQSLVEATGGSFSVDTVVQGDIEKPLVDTKAIATQLIKQVLLRSAEDGIEKKAGRFGEYIDKKIKKQLKK